MPNADGQLDLPAPAANDGSLFPAVPLHLRVTFNLAAGQIDFEWAGTGGSKTPIVARGRLVPSELTFSGLTLDWFLDFDDKPRNDFCSAWPASIRALLNRIRRIFPLADEGPRIGLLSDTDLGPARAGELFPLLTPPGEDFWKRLARDILEFARILETKLASGGDSVARGSAALRWLACARLGVAPNFDDLLEKGASIAPLSKLLHLRVTFDQVKGFAELVWSSPEDRSFVAAGRVRGTGGDQLSWETETNGGKEISVTSHHRNSIRAELGKWLKRFPTNRESLCALWVKPRPGGREPLIEQEPPFGPHESPYVWIEDNIVAMAEALRFQSSPLGRIMQEMDPLALTEFERHGRRLLRKEQKRAQQEERRRETMARLAEQRRREQHEAAARKAAEARKTPPAKANLQSQISNLKSAAPAPERAPLPPVPVRIEFPELAFQETTFPLTDLCGYFLRERAALWWVSNQSDDLLCLPHCRIERLDYQVRTALRVLGPLRGRALLSDEVGLGKTIEAGLVLKELLTRGMVKKFLVLTVPSLVDQWEEELSDKFGLTTVTTNHEGARNDPQKFWRVNAGLVASLHTLKQPAHLEIARQTHWDLLIVDEAHYLRNRDSQAWQAVNALPRQFLLLLTATPVQNSLEELYNLVTLLQPGQLPSPKEFRARFVDPKRPRQPREPEELRRLLGQVMIRNTRANAGLKLPPRRAETVLFEPDEAERAFWQQWESEFRARLAELNASQASLWGRLLLQAAGSSPAAWRGALEKFPQRNAARTWREQAPLENSWKRKCELLAPLTKAEGGAVIFTQFLETQAALAQRLSGVGVETFVINGTTPPPERQPITEEFRKRGGALLLTHSGTEGRNLQFCHRLANFDLPWNPMEIEQRIGRLHRLGQQHPVRIYNFVQAGTLQEHLLEVLQEKLNLFELVVGETGLVLGEKFGSGEFADEVLRRWRESEGRVAEAFASLGDELAAARSAYAEVKQLDETLFAKDYES
jgi:superfamily II DNA or RNA helicase